MVWKSESIFVIYGGIMPSEYYLRIEKAVYDIGFYLDRLEEKEGYSQGDILDVLWWLTDIYQDMKKHSDTLESDDDK